MKNLAILKSRAHIKNASRNGSQLVRRQQERTK